MPSLLQTGTHPYPLLRRIQLPPNPRSRCSYPLWPYANTAILAHNSPGLQVVKGRRMLHLQIQAPLLQSLRWKERSLSSRHLQVERGGGMMNEEQQKKFEEWCANYSFSAVTSV